MPRFPTNGGDNQPPHNRHVAYGPLYLPTEKRDAGRPAFDAGKTQSVCLETNTREGKESRWFAFGCCSELTGIKPSDHSVRWQPICSTRLPSLALTRRVSWQAREAVLARSNHRSEGCPRGAQSWCPEGEQRVLKSNTARATFFVDIFWANANADLCPSLEEDFFNRITQARSDKYGASYSIMHTQGRDGVGGISRL